jgi:hypothetical protein
MEDDMDRIGGFHSRAENDERARLARAALEQARIAVADLDRASQPGRVAAWRRMLGAVQDLARRRGFSA